MESAWDDVVRVDVVSMIGGKYTAEASLKELRKDDNPEILRAFANDEDLIEMRVISTCIGFVRTYTKKFKKIGQCPSIERKI